MSKVAATSHSAEKLEPKRPVPWGLVALNWFLPGAGFFAIGRTARGALQCGIVMTTFLLGLILHGGVAWPAWSPNQAEFNLINNFNFIIQFGTGLPGLISLAAHEMNWPILGGDPKHAYYELGGYYLVAAGFANYFMTCNLSDRLRGLNPKLRAQEEGRAAI